MAEPDGCSGESLLAPCTKKKRLQRKMTKHYHWISVQEIIGMFSKSLSDRNSCLCLKYQLGLCSLNCHTHAMTENCFAS